MTDDEIEEAAEAFLSDPDNISGVEFSDLVDIFVAGARWAEEQLP